MSEQFNKERLEKVTAEFKEGLKEAHKDFLDKIEIYGGFSGESTSFVSCISFGANPGEYVVGCYGEIEHMFYDIMETVLVLYKECNELHAKRELTYNFVKAFAQDNFAGLDLLELLVKRLRAEGGAEKELPSLPQF